MKFRTITNILWLLKNHRQIKNWKKRNFSPPSPEFVKHQIIQNNNIEKSAWIETGTYYGDTTKILSRISSKVISIEADQDLYELAKKTFSNLENIELMFGRSEDKLPEAFKKIKTYKNICIYLDAHLCNDHIKNKKTFGVEKDATPIKKELKFIEEQKDKFNKINILIDDIRLFNNKFQNYPKKDYLVNWCKNNNFDWEIEQDIFICKKII